MLLGETRPKRPDRPPIPRPRDDAPTTFVCPACDVVLWDGVAYLDCPACDRPVDWVDLTQPLWCCPTCDHLVNEPRAETPDCERCARPLLAIEARERPPADIPGKARSRGRLRRLLEATLDACFTALLFLGAIGPLLSLALDPRWRGLALALAAPLLLVPVAMGGVWLWSLGTCLGELRDLARDAKTRVIHGLEHATIKLLEKELAVIYGGLTHDGFFEVRMRNEGRPADQLASLRKAANDAIGRVRRGERGLAYDSRCGTSLVVTGTLVALMAVASGAVGLFLHLRPEALLALGGAFVLVFVVLAKPLGLLAQRFLTVSTTFRGARVIRVSRTLTHGGERVCFDVYLQIHKNGPRPRRPRRRRR